jgi:hypothetical protein
VPLDANFQDDRRIIDVSVEAELVYLRALGLTKRLEEDAGTCWLSEGHLRKLCDKLDLDRPGRLAVAAELVAVGAWLFDDSADAWVVRAWASWNVSLGEASERKRDGARLGNHRRHGHKGELSTCPICSKAETGAVFPGGSLVGKRPDTDRFASRSSSLDVDVDVDVDQPPPTPSVNRADAADEPGLVLLVELADQLVEAIGIVGEVANQGERNYVARAVANGWAGQELIDEALAIGSRDDVRDHRAYLGAVLKRYANDAPAAGPPRPRLDDERPPCDDCGGSGWIDLAEERTVARCPACDRSTPHAAEPDLLPAPHTGGLTREARATARAELAAGLAKSRGGDGQ